MNRRWLWIVVLPPACIAYQWLMHALVVDADATSGRVPLAFLIGVPHAAINIALIWVFGRTLMRGREALVTGYARRVHGIVPAYIAPYTRRVTAAWCLFFAAQVVLSVVLFTAGPLDTWSLFVNLLSFPLVIVMFVAEYLYRIARFPDHPHVPIWKGIQMFVGRGRDTRPTEARSQS